MCCASPPSFLPSSMQRAVDVLQAWFTLHISHRDWSEYLEAVTGVPILAPKATAVAFSLLASIIGWRTIPAPRMITRM